MCPYISFFLLSQHSHLRIFHRYVVVDISLGFTSNCCGIYDKSFTFKMNEENAHYLYDGTKTVEYTIDDLLPHGFKI